MFAGLLLEIHFHIVNLLLSTNISCLNCNLALLTDLGHQCLASFHLLLQTVLFECVQLIWSSRSRCRCSLCGSVVHHTWRRLLPGQMRGTPMSRAVFSVFCMSIAALSMSVGDVSEENSSFAMKNVLENFSLSVMYHAWNSLLACMVAVKEKVVAMWSEPSIMPLCQCD